MSLEGQLFDQKSLRAVTGKTTDWSEIAKDCVAFANATGGRLLLGIEDGQDAPPAGQHIPADLLDTVRRKLAERTVNVTVLPDVVTAPNGGQYIELRIPSEGSGFDKIFEVLLSQGRPAPELIETHDRVQVTIRRRILKPKVIDFIAKADQTYQLTQRERIALGLLAQHDALTARELANTLELPSVEALQPWLKRLLDWNLVQSAGRTQATRYFVDPGLLHSLNFTGGTTLKRIEPHRLLALIVEDVGRYPNTKIGDIHQRVGLEIPRSRVRRAIEQLVTEEKLIQEGVRSGTRYRLP